MTLHNIKSSTAQTVRVRREAMMTTVFRSLWV